MSPNDIREKLNRQPFQPLRVHVSDGAAYELRHPGDAAVSQMEMYIGIEPDDTGIPTRAIYIDTRHVTRIEPLPGSAAPPSGGGRRR